MLLNFALAILLIIAAIGLLVVLDRLSNQITQLVRFALRFTRRSKLLTEYLLRAYLRYKRSLNKPHFNL